MQKLLAIATRISVSGLALDDEDFENARRAGANDEEIHDTVLIASAFCMFNRYVDGLAAFTPDDPELYDQVGKMLATEGYARGGST
jgi:hypothetical protein